MTRILGLGFALGLVLPSLPAWSAASPDPVINLMSDRADTKGKIAFLRIEPDEAAVARAPSRYVCRPAPSGSPVQRLCAEKTPAHILSVEDVEAAFLVRRPIPSHPENLSRLFRGQPMDLSLEPAGGANLQHEFSLTLRLTQRAGQAFMAFAVANPWRRFDLRVEDSILNMSSISGPNARREVEIVLSDDDREQHLRALAPLKGRLRVR